MGKYFLSYLCKKCKFLVQRWRLQNPDFVNLGDNAPPRWTRFGIEKSEFSAYDCIKASRELFRMSKWTMFKNRCQKWQLSSKQPKNQMAQSVHLKELHGNFFISDIYLLFSHSIRDPGLLTRKQTVYLFALIEYSPQWL